MDEETVRQIIRDEMQEFFASDRYIFSKTIQMLDGRNIQLAIGTGTKIGTTTTQKLGFFNAAPVAQRAAMTAVNNGTVNSGDAVTDNVITNSRTRINEIEAGLETLGLFAAN